MKYITPENILLIGSTMLLVSVVVGRAGSRFGVPSLLLFLCVGMFMGSDGVGYHFDDANTAQFLGIMALSVILFSGGMDTKISDVKPIAAEGVVLATAGVALTAGLTGVFIYGVSGFFGFNMGITESLLLAAVMSSTDSASVFSLLRSKGLRLSERLRPTLELESGSNDPMAYILTVALVAFIQGEGSGWYATGMLILQLSIGAFAGWGLGKATVFFVGKIKLQNDSLCAVMLVGCAFFIYSLTDKLYGNGYLAVYIAGVVVGNSTMARKRAASRFFEGFAWLWQIVIFLTLGLLVNPRELFEVTWFGLAVGAFMIVFGRPISVFACLIPFKKFSRKAMCYISWVGLRGAVPIIFATYPLTADVPFARVMFNAVFFITIMSLAIQGMTVISMAKYLKVTDDSSPRPLDFGVELPEEVKSSMSEIEVDDKLLAGGNTLAKLNLPNHTLAMLVRRSDSYFIPKGGTILMKGDKLLVISDNADELSDVCNKLGISRYEIERNS